MSCRIPALFLAFLLIFMLTACISRTSGLNASSRGMSSISPESAGDSRSALEASESIPNDGDSSSQASARNPTKIVYPQLADERLTSSALYQRALGQPSVIIYQDEVLTDPQPVRDFMESVDEGMDCGLYIYTFRLDHNGEPDCYLAHFISTESAITYSGAYENNWDALTESGCSKVTSISFNEYGFLVYEMESSSEASGIQVVNNRALYNNAEERQKMYDTYLVPIYYTALGNRVWASPEELSSWIWLFEELYNYENDDTPWDRFGSNWPVETMVKTLSRYFEGVTADMVISEPKYADAYDPETNTIFYEGGRGGGPLCLRVTSWMQEGDRLVIDYEGYEYYSGVPWEDGFYTLTVKTMEDGSFRYLSNLPRN